MAEAPPTPQAPSAADNLTIISQSQRETISLVSNIINLVSIVACSALLVGYYFLKTQSPVLMSRVSLRLIVATAACTVGFSLVQVLSNLLQGESFWCSFSAYAYTYFSLVTTFLITAVTYNLHLVFIRRKKETLTLEAKYYAVCFVAAFAISTPAYVANMYGWSENTRMCWTRDEHFDANRWWTFFSYHVWVLLVVLYNVAMVAWVLRKLYRNRQFIYVDMQALAHAQERLAAASIGGSAALLMKKEKKKQLFIEMVQMVTRIVQYPVVLIVVQIPTVASDMLELWFSTPSPYWLVFVSYATTAVLGVMVSAVFWYDPTIQRAIEHTKQQLVYEYLEREQQTLASNEWGLGVDPKKQEKEPLWSRWRNQAIGRFLVSEADRQDLKNVQDEAQRKRLFRPSMPPAPQPSLAAERVRTYELEVGAMGTQDIADEEVAQDVDYWESIKLHL